MGHVFYRMLEREIGIHLEVHHVRAKHPMLVTKRPPYRRYTLPDAIYKSKVIQICVGCMEGGGGKSLGSAFDAAHAFAISCVKMVTSIRPHTNMEVPDLSAVKCALPDRQGSFKVNTTDSRTANWFPFVRFHDSDEYGCQTVLVDEVDLRRVTPSPSLCR
jgi:hypothetical protein